jgi:hypothetical protein
MNERLSDHSTVRLEIRYSNESEDDYANHLSEQDAKRPVPRLATQILII